MAGRKTYPGSIDRHGQVWRIRLCVGGERRVFKMDGAMPREEVEQHAREKDAELRRRNGRGLPGPMPISELLDRFEKVDLPTLAPNTRKTYAGSLAAFRTDFVEEGDDPRANEVRPGHVQGFLHWRRTRNPDGSGNEPPSRPGPWRRTGRSSTPCFGSGGPWRWSRGTRFGRSGPRRGMPGSPSS